MKIHNGQDKTKDIKSSPKNSQSKIYMNADLIKNLAYVLKEWLSQTVNLTLGKILNHSHTGTHIHAHTMLY